MTKIPLVSPQRCEEEEELYPQATEPYKGKIWLSDDPRPEDVQGVAIQLDGRVNSTLDWSKQLVQAAEMKAQGLKILWKLDLGLFEGLENPLNDEGQILSLRLSLQHFRETVWDKFQEQTIALQIYEGDVTFSCLTDSQTEQSFPFNEWVVARKAENLTPEIAQAYHRRDLAAEYLSLLTIALPDDLRLLMSLKVPSELPYSVVVGLLNPDRFEKIEWTLDGLLPLHATWQQKDSLLIPNNTGTSPVGFCIPFPEWMPDRKERLDDLLHTYPELRLIPEGAITSQWEMLDQLYVMEKFVTPFGRRQLQGFIAAGGVKIPLL